MDSPHLHVTKRSSSNRRVSLDDSMNQLIVRIRSTMDRLNQLWDEVHMEERARESRVEYAYLHFYTLLDEIIKAEEDMVKGVRSDIEVRRIAIADLRQTLNMTNFDESAFPQNSIALLRALDKELNVLTKKRDVAVEAQLKEYEILAELCQRLDKRPAYDYNDIRCRVFSPDELHKIQMDRKKMAELVATRSEHVNKLQSECRRMYKALKEASSFSAEQHNLLNADFDAPCNLISDDVVNNLEKLHTFMSDAYAMWLEQAAFQYSELLIEFRDIAEKCCVEHRCDAYPDEFDPQLHDRESLDKLAEETKELKRRYEMGGSVFDKFSHWKALWQEKLNREAEASSSKFYQNRGGQLNSFLKRQKQLGVLVPKALDDLRTAVQDYLYMECGDGNDIRIDNMLPDEYAEFLINEHREEKELQKTMKSTQQSGTLYLMKKTPLKRQTPSKPMKVQSSKVARRKYSLGKQKLSIISPIRTPMCGPKTSSPKNLWATVHTTRQRTPLTGAGAANYSSRTTAAATSSNSAVTAVSRSRLPRAVFNSHKRRNDIGGTPLSSWKTKTPQSSRRVDVADSTRTPSGCKGKTPVVAAHWKY